MTKDPRRGDRHGEQALSVRLGADRSLLGLLVGIRYPDIEKKTTGERRLVQEAVTIYLKQQMIDDEVFRDAAMESLSQPESGKGTEHESRGATAT